VQTERTYKRQGKEQKMDTSNLAKEEKEEIPVEPVKEEEQPAVDERQEMVDALLESNEELTNRLAVAAMDATHEEKQMASDLIASLREELRIAKIELVAVKLSRDTFQRENVQLKSQVRLLQRKLGQA
jgi:hypothetical protein